MLRRKVYDILSDWKKREHMCLLLKGQRQVGKTFIVRQFAKDNYANILEINFQSDLRAHEAFGSDLRVDTIIANLCILSGRSDVEPGKTLLFFDDIQECPKARASLKSFSEDGRYDVIASGSLLGVEDSNLFNRDGERPPLLPMGYEEHVTMYGLDFEEFLWALGSDDRITEIIRSHIRKREPMGKAMVDGLMSRFREFMTVGGMPKCVSDYIVRRNPMDCLDDMKGIIDTVVNDINRYNSKNEGIKTLACFRSIGKQLSDTNKRFMLSRIDEGGAEKPHRFMDKYRKNLLWIRFSGIGNIG